MPFSTLIRLPAVEEIKETTMEVEDFTIDKTGHSSIHPNSSEENAAIVTDTVPCKVGQMDTYANRDTVKSVGTDSSIKSPNSSKKKKLGKLKKSEAIQDNVESRKATHVEERLKGADFDQSKSLMGSNVVSAKKKRKEMEISDIGTPDNPKRKKKMALSASKVEIVEMGPTENVALMGALPSNKENRTNLTEDFTKLKEPFAVEDSATVPKSPKKKVGIF